MRTCKSKAVGGIELDMHVATRKKGGRKDNISGKRGEKVDGGKARLLLKGMILIRKRRIGGEGLVMKNGEKRKLRRWGEEVRSIVAAFAKKLIGRFFAERKGGAEGSKYTQKTEIRDTRHVALQSRGSASGSRLAGEKKAWGG